MSEQTILIIANAYDGAVLGQAVADAGYVAHLVDDTEIGAQGGETSGLVDRLGASLAAVVLDHALGDAQSSAVLRELRDVTDGVPVVLIGSKASGMVSLADAIRFGADHLLSRPLEPALVTSKIDALVSLGRGARAELEEVRRKQATGPMAPLPDARVESLDDLAAAAPPLPDGSESEAPDGAAGAPGGPVAPPDALVELPDGGRLESIDTPALIRLLHARAFSGKLILRRDEQEKQIFFEDGYPVFATSNTDHDRIGALLGREGRVSEEQLDALGAEQQVTGRRFGALLVDRGLLKPDELFPLVRRHVREIIYSLFSWGVGEFALEAGASAGGEQIRLKQHPSAVIAEGIRRKYGLERLVERVGDSSVRVRLRDGAQQAVAEAALEAEELELVRRLAGEQTMGALAAFDVLDETRCYQLVYTLLLLGAAAARGSGHSPIYDIEAMTTRRARELAVDARRINAKVEQVREGDYFSLLGLKIDASRREVEQAYLRLSAELDADLLPKELVAEHADALEEIHTVLLEARRVLGSDALRDSYRRSLAE